MPQIQIKSLEYLEFIFAKLTWVGVPVPAQSLATILSQNMSL